MPNTVKIAFLGDSGAGRSQLNNELTYKGFVEGQGSTIGVVSEFYDFEDGCGLAEFCDYPGQEIFAYSWQSKEVMDKCTVIVLAIALSDENALNTLKRYYETLTKDINQSSKKIVIVGTKFDWGDDDECKRACNGEVAVKDFCEQNGLAFYTTSVKSGDKVAFLKESANDKNKRGVNRLREHLAEKTKLHREYHQLEFNREKARQDYQQQHDLIVKKLNAYREKVNGPFKLKKQEKNKLIDKVFAYLSQILKSIDDKEGTLAFLNVFDKNIKSYSQENRLLSTSAASPEGSKDFNEILDEMQKLFPLLNELSVKKSALYKFELSKKWNELKEAEKKEKENLYEEKSYQPAEPIRHEVKHAHQETSPSAPVEELVKNEVKHAHQKNSPSAPVEEPVETSPSVPVEEELVKNAHQETSHVGEVDEVQIGEMDEENVREPGALEDENLLQPGDVEDEEPEKDAASVVSSVADVKEEFSQPVKEPKKEEFPQPVNWSGASEQAIKASSEPVVSEKAKGECLNPALWPKAPNKNCLFGKGVEEKKEESNNKKDIKKSGPLFS